MKSQCDHTVSYLHNFVTESELTAVLKAEVQSWNSYGERDERIIPREYKATDFLDRRKGYITMFNHCPYCGDKIDWRSIKKHIAEVTSDE